MAAQEISFTSNSDCKMNTTKSINKFVVRFFIATIPLILLLVAYICLDPFMVITPIMPEYGHILPCNKALISLQAYENGRHQNHYNAFIFGSSRSIYYLAKDWSEHLPSDASIIHMDAATETTEGILLKMRYIEEKGDTIQYALIEFAPWSFSSKVQDATSYRTPYQLDGSSPIVFHWKYFRDFLQRDFIKTYSMYLLTGSMVERGKHKIFSRYSFEYDATTNECFDASFDKMLTSIHEVYLKIRFTPQELAVEFARDSIPPTLPQAIDAPQEEMLKEMRRIFDRHNTDYRIIIGPNWQREIISPHDLKILQTIFPSDRVHDFCLYHEATDSINNFYDHTHYRPKIAKAILDSIYQ